MTKAKKLPSGNWRAVGQYYDANGKRRYKSFTEKTEAKANYAAEQFEEKSNHYSIENMTVSEAMQAYIDKKEKSLSPTTVTYYKMIRRNHLQPLMSIKLSKLTNEKIQLAINQENLASKTVRNAHGFLTAVLAEYMPDFKVRVELPKKKKKIYHIPNNDELKIIFQAAKGTELEIPILLAVYLGLRKSEIRGLKYTDIRDGKITIKNTIVDTEDGPTEKDTTKTISSTRTVLLPEVLIKKLSESSDSSEYITTLSGNVIYQRFQKLLKENNLPHFRFHDLRHTSASIMLRLNIPTKYAMERGGWATQSTLQTVYQHTMADYAQEVDKQIYDYIDNIIK